MRATSRRGAFTLIEVLIAVGIITLLTTLMVMGMMGSARKAKIAGTTGLILKVKTAMQMYFAEFRDYPPDGYDDEPPIPGGSAWVYNAQGVVVGTPGRGVKGTASLIYFLCRPLTKVTVVGADPTDPRNRQTKVVGPFLNLEEGDFTQPGFNPNHPWSDNAYWNGQGYIKTEIKDKFFRPLVYDKVKTGSPVYFQPGRFHVHGGGSGTLPRGVGRYVHPDQNFMDNVMTVLPHEEKACGDETHDPGIEGMSHAQLLDIHTDPRFVPNSPARAPDGCPSGGGSFLSGFPTGTTTTHEPKSQGGGYDLWSYGPSYINCKDDITSWDN